MARVGGVEAGYARQSFTCVLYGVREGEVLRRMACTNGRGPFRRSSRRARRYYVMYFFTVTVVMVSKRLFGFRGCFLEEIS